MSYRFGTSLVPGAYHYGRGGLGILGSLVPSSGANGPSALYPSLTLPADNNVEVRGFLTRLPAVGSLSIAEDGSFTYTAPVGTLDYFDFRLYFDGAASTADIGFGAGIARVYLQVSPSNMGGPVLLDDAWATGQLVGGVAAISAIGGAALLDDALSGTALSFVPSAMSGAILLDDAGVSASLSGSLYSAIGGAILLDDAWATGSLVGAHIGPLAATLGYIGGAVTTTYQKDPGESIVVAFDFSANATAVQSPSPTQIFVCASLTGGDNNPGALLSGPSSIDPTNPARVLQRVALGGLNFTDYELKCYASDANGDELLRVIVIQVRTR